MIVSAAAAYQLREAAASLALPAGTEAAVPAQPSPSVGPGSTCPRTPWLGSHPLNLSALSTGLSPVTPRHPKPR